MILNITKKKYIKEKKKMYAPPEDLNKLTLKNTDYRRVHETYKGWAQLVLMSIPPGGNIPMEIHPKTIQFIRSEQGTATVTRDGQVDILMEDGHVFIIPGVEHEVVNSGDVDLKLYTIYYPPEHPEGLVQTTQPNESVNEGEIKDFTLFFYTRRFISCRFDFLRLPFSTSIN